MPARQNARGVTLAELIEREDLPTDSENVQFVELLGQRMEQRWQESPCLVLAREQAEKFFHETDRVLIEAGVIYPPRGEVDLLRNALSPRMLSDAEYAQAEGHPNNARRIPWMRAHRRADSPFFYADCDTASVLYLAIGERL